MSRLNKDLISDLQSRTFKEKIDASSVGVDLNLKGLDIVKEDPNSFIKYNDDAHVNRALLWFTSKPYDYVRESTKGGILYQMVGDLNNPDRLSFWESEIRKRFNEEFSSELTILQVKLTLNKIFRKLIIDMIVQDNIKREISRINTEVAL